MTDKIPQAKKDYRPRLYCEVSEEMKARWDELLPWAVRSKFIEAVLRDVQVLLEDEELRKVIIGGILAGEISVKDILQGKKNG